MEEQQVYAYEFEGTRYDAGTTMGWLKASVELALAAPRPRAPSSGPTCTACSSDGSRRGRAVRCRRERATLEPDARPTQREGTTWRRSGRSWAAAIA